MNPLVTIALRFMLLSLIAVGGVTTIVPEVHRIVVDVHHWVGDAEFTRLFVIARAAPGPNMLLVTLIGWQVGGLPGALVATAATCLPSCTLTFFAVRVWQRFRGARGRQAVEAGLAPITIGLVLATGWLVARGARAGWMAHVLTAGSAVVALLPRINPIWLLAGAGLLGLLGLV